MNRKQRRATKTRARAEWPIEALVWLPGARGEVDAGMVVRELEEEHPSRPEVTVTVRLDVNLAVVPNRLRELADQLERKDP